MKKRIAMALLVLMMGMVLFGCGSKPLEPPKDLTRTEYIENAQKVANTSMAYFRESKATDLNLAMAELEKKKKLTQYRCADDTINAFGQYLLQREGLEKADLAKLPAARKKAFKAEMTKTIPNAVALVQSKEAVGSYDFKGEQIVFYKSGLAKISHPEKKAKADTPATKENKSRK